MEREENIYKKKPCEIRGLAECYRFYKDKVGRNGIGYRTYAKVCREFNIRMANKIITESFEFRLPYRLGFLANQSYRSKDCHQGWEVRHDKKTLLTGRLHGLIGGTLSRDKYQKMRRII